MSLDMDELEELTGVSKELVKKAALAYAGSKSAMELHGLGVTEHFQGSKTVMLLSNLAMMTGNIGRPRCWPQSLERTKQCPGSG